MSKLRQKDSQGRSRRSTLQAWGYYLLALTAWVTIVLVVSVLGFIICRSLPVFQRSAFHTGMIICFAKPIQIQIIFRII